MLKPLVSVPGGKGWIDIGSYGRHGPGRRDRLSPKQVAFIARTVHRTPEVMIKMLNQGGRSLGSVARHLNYLDRNGELRIETDEGDALKGKGAAKELIDDWDLKLDELRTSASLRAPTKGDPPKLVHKMIFSMPAGTPPKKVLEAVKNFAREEFALKHRYAMVLHTDEPHPHVHMVVKAMGDDGRRLNIRRATLREWRREFARHLRAQGVAANATERTLRGVTRPQKTDGIYRAAQRGASTHWRERAGLVAHQIAHGGLKVEPGKARLMETRRDVVRGWSEVADDLVIQGHVELAQVVRGFLKQLPPVKTDREWIRDRMLEQARARADRREHILYKESRRDADRSSETREHRRDLDGYSR